VSDPAPDDGAQSEDGPRAQQEPNRYMACCTDRYLAELERGPQSEIVAMPVVATDSTRCELIFVALLAPEEITRHKQLVLEPLPGQQHPAAGRTDLTRRRYELVVAGQYACYLAMETLTDEERSPLSPLPFHQRAESGLLAVVDDFVLLRMRLPGWPVMALHGLRMLLSVSAGRHMLNAPTPLSVSIPSVETLWMQIEQELAPTHPLVVARTERALSYRTKDNSRLLDLVRMILENARHAAAR